MKQRTIKTLDGKDCYHVINGIVRMSEQIMVRMSEQIMRKELTASLEPIIYTDVDGWTVIEGRYEATEFGSDQDLWARVFISSSDMFAQIYTRQSLFKADAP